MLMNIVVIFLQPHRELAKPLTLGNCLRKRLWAELMRLSFNQAQLLCKIFSSFRSPRCGIHIASQLDRSVLLTLVRSIDLLIVTPGFPCLERVSLVFVILSGAFTDTLNLVMFFSSFQHVIQLFCNMDDKAYHTFALVSCP